MLSSTGGAAVYQGNKLGEYQRAGEWEGKSFWRQRSGFGILFYNGMNWVVSDELSSGNNGWLWSNVDSEKPPMTGWEYWNLKKEEWGRDSNMTLSCGSLIPCSRVKLNIQGNGESEGVYRLTTTWLSGRPVYEHKEKDLFLYVAEGLTHWSVSDRLTSNNDSIIIQSYRATNSPADPRAAPWLAIFDGYHSNSEYSVQCRV